MASATVGILKVLLTANTAEFETAMKRSQNLAQDWSRDLRRAGQQLTQVGSALTKTLTLPILGLGTASAKMAIDFESSFAGVRKTVNATEQQFAELAQGMRDLSKTIPINVNELNKIGETAGQLGIKTENILGFTKVMAQLGVTTSLSSEEAAVALAQLANITQMPQTEFDRLGSTIVDLGNALATNETKIVDFGLRIAAAGELAGMSEHQILSIGAAMASVGVEAEAGGTAVQKVINGMTKAVATGNDSLKIFAATAGMSAEEFKAAWKEDAGAAFAAFVQGLGKQGDNAFRILDGLKLGNERVVRSFLSLANAGDLLTRSLEIGATGWRENTALTIEAQKRFETVEAKLTLLWNRLKDVGITLGNALLPMIERGIGALDRLIPILDQAVKAFTAMPDGIQFAAVGLLGLVAAAGPALFVMGQLALSASAILKMFEKQGIATKALHGAMRLLKPIVSGLGGAFELLQSAGAAVLRVASPLITWLGRLAAGSSALLGPLAAIVALGVGLFTWLARWTEIGPRSESVLQKLWAVAKDLAGLLRDGLVVALRMTADVLGVVWDIAKSVANVGLALLSEELRNTIDSVDDLIGFLGALTKVFEHVPGPVKSFITALGVVEVALDVLAAKIKRVRDDMELMLAVSGEGAAAMTLPSVEGPAGPGGALVGPLPIPQIEGLARSIRAVNESTTDWNALLGKNDEAQKKAKEAAKKLADEINRQRQALSALGITTEREVNAQLAEFATLMARAEKEGVPLETVLKAIAPKLLALAHAARLSGLELPQLANAWRDLSGALEDFQAIPDLLQASAFDFSVLEQGMSTVSLETFKAAREARELEDAYKSLGLTSQAELRRLANEAKDAYQAILRSTKSTLKEQEVARQAWIAAERRAAGQTVTLWSNTWASLLTQAQQFYQRSAGNLLQVLTGIGVQADESLKAAATSAIEHYQALVRGGEASSEDIANAYKKMVEAIDAANITFTDRMKAFWKEFVNMALSAVSQVLQAVSQSLIGGLIGLFRGQQGAMASAFAGIFGGGGGGAMNFGVPGVSLPGGPGAGGGFASSTLGGSLIGGGVGFGVGFGVGSRHGRGAGALSGAASGFGTGFMLGGPIGGLIGGAAGLIGGLFGGGRNNTLRDRQAFSQQLGFNNQDDIFRALHEGGASNAAELQHRALNVIGRKDDAANQRWMDDVLAAFDEINRKAAELQGRFGALTQATAQYGGTAPQAMHPMIESMLQSNQLTAEQRSLLEGMVGEPGWEVMEAKAKQYGIELAALGPQFQQSKLNELAAQYADDFQFLMENGADMNGVLRGMQDEVQALIDTSLEFGTTIPENMRPMLESMVQMGLLTDANGDALEDLSSIEFGPAVKGPMDEIADILRDIFVLLGGELPAAAGRGAEAIKRAFADMDIRIPVGFDFEDPDAPTIGRPGGRSPGGDGGELPIFHSGTDGLRDFGAGTLALLGGVERVQTAAQMRAEHAALLGTAGVRGGDGAMASIVNVYPQVTINALDGDSVWRVVRSPEFGQAITSRYREDPDFKRQTNRGLS